MTSAHSRRSRVLNEFESSGIHEMLARWGEAQARDIINVGGGTEAGRTEGVALVEALTSEAAFRIARTLRALYPGGLTKKQREGVVDDLTQRFTEVLASQVGAAVSLAALVDEEGDGSDEAPDFASVVSAAMERMRADLTERHVAAAAAAAATGTAWTRTNPDGSVDNIAPSDVYPRAEETSPAPEPAEAPDAGKANPMPRTTAAAQGALDALAAEQAKPKPRVYRFDESGEFPAAPQRIETEGERG